MPVRRKRARAGALVHNRATPVGDTGETRNEGMGGNAPERKTCV